MSGTEGRDQIRTAISHDVTSSSARVTADTCERVLHVRHDALCSDMNISWHSPHNLPREVFPCGDVEMGLRGGEVTYPMSHSH